MLPYNPHQNQMIPFKLNIIILLFSGLFLVSCETESQELPKVSIYDLTLERNSKTESIGQIKIFIYPQSSKTITLQYKMVNGTAKAGKDYFSDTNSITISPYQSEAIIEVRISADSVRAADQKFSIELISAENATFSERKIGVCTIQNNGNILIDNNSGYEAATNYQGKTRVWSEEFEGTEINNSVWSFDTGDSGWGNNEWQNYTTSKKNAFVSNGLLAIEARQESVNPAKYTSARLKSIGKKYFTYGRIDIRAKLPSGKGIWPALWMLGENITTLSWPACGEIDIMEQLGHEPQKSYGTLHWGAIGGPSTHVGGNYSLANGNFSDKFHVFSIDWTTDKIDFFVDDIRYYSVQKSQVNGDYPFNKPFFFILNVAVGGNWPGYPDYTTVFPQRMLVDYIRVYQ